MYNYPSEHLFNDLNILTAANLYKLHLLTLMYRFVNNLVSCSLHKAFDFNMDVHLYTRNHKEPHIYASKSSIYCK